MRPIAVPLVLLALATALPALPDIPRAALGAQPIEEFHAYLRPDTCYAVPGAVVDLRFEVDATAQQFNGYGVTLHLDPTIATPDTVFEGPSMVRACANRFRDFEKTDSTMAYTHVLLCAGVALNGPDTLSIFRFRVDQYGTCPLTIITNPDQAFYDFGRYVAPTHPTRPRQVILHHAVLIVLDPTSQTPEPAHGRLERGPVRVSPNPVSPESTIQIDLAGVDRVDMRLLDPGGRCLWSRDAHLGDQGALALPWSEVVREASVLSGGVYFLQIDWGSDRFTTRAVVCH